MENNTQEEVVLTLKRETFEAYRPFSGYRSLVDSEELNKYLMDKDAMEFVPRSKAEKDPSFKQLIPYVAIICDDEILMYERSPKGGEERLHGETAIGIGGHVNTDDDPGEPWFTLSNGAIREIKEEVGVEIGHNELQKSLIGLVNDEDSDVGKVHLGVCYVVGVPPEHKETMLKSCEDTMLNARFEPIINLEEQEVFDSLETWSKYLALGYIQESSKKGKWNDPGFRERMGMLIACTSQLTAASAGMLMEETPKTHMMAKDRLERAAGEVQCMLAGLIHNKDIEIDKLQTSGKEFKDELGSILRHQAEEE